MKTTPMVCLRCGRKGDVVAKSTLLVFGVDEHELLVCHLYQIF